MKNLLFVASLLFIAFQAQAKVKVFPAQVALITQPGWAESPIWDTKTNRLYWIDMRDKIFHISSMSDGKDESFQLPEQPGTLILTKKGNRVIIPLVSAIYAYDFDKKELVKVVDNPNLHNGKPNRFNDGDCDPAGRLWVGTENKDGSGFLYRVTNDFVLRPMVSGVKVSNGLCFSTNKKTLYYIDSQLQTVDAFKYNNRTGEISNRKTVVEFPKEMGTPDGMTIDTNGMLWVCSMDVGRCVSGWNPHTGEMFAKVELPTQNALACTFGGENLDILYITTENGIYQANVGSKGTAPYLFKE